MNYIAYGFLILIYAVFAWFGKAISIKEEITDEESYITETIPKETNTMCAICGTALVAHYSFFTQKSHLDTTDILQQYKELTLKDIINRV